MFYHHLKIAFRSLLSRKLFTLINIVGLSIGMAAALLISLWVQNEFTYDRHHPKGKDIYRIISTTQSKYGTRSSDLVQFPLMLAAGSEIPEVLLLSKNRVLREPTLNIGSQQSYQEKSLCYVDQAWFDLFSYDILAGSIQALFENPNHLALSEALARKYFGEDEALGKRVEFKDISYIVKMVYKDPPTNSILQFPCLIPFEAYWFRADKGKSLNDWNNSSFRVFLQTEQPEIVAQKLTALKRKNIQLDGYEFLNTLEPLQDIHFSTVSKYSPFPHQQKSTVLIFGIIGFILLVAALLNYLSLSTALIYERIREIGIKKVIGASFQTVFSQVLLEALMVSLLAIILALEIGKYSLPLLHSFTGVPIVIDLGSLPIWGVIGVILLLSICLAGLYPALLFAGIKPIRLTKSSKNPQSNISLRKGLVVTQFALALIILLCTIVMGNQLSYIQKKKVGYDRSYVVQFQPKLYQGDSEYNYKQFSLWQQVLQEIPEFQAVAVSIGSIIDIGNFNGDDLSWEGKDPNLLAGAYRYGVNEALQEVFDLKLIAGRWFDSSYETDQNNIVLNETAVKTFQIPEPIIGRQIVWRGEAGTIIGIAKDFHFQSLHKKIEPLVMFYTDQNGGSTVLARTTGVQASEALSQAQTSFEKFLPNLIFEYEFLDDSFEEMHRTEINMGFLFKIFAGILLFISCLGLLGLSTFEVLQRTKEIGIRKVLGARVQQIVQLLSSDFLKLVLVAFLIASPIAWFAMDRWLESFAYRVPIMWWMFVLTGLFALTLAFLTVGFQSFRAAVASPIHALRSE
ncbi:MAG: FtsX-like permease family protein [Bacteroidota bacterium]